LLGLTARRIGDGRCGDSVGKFGEAFFQIGPNDVLGFKEKDFLLISRVNRWVPVCVAYPAIDESRTVSDTLQRLFIGA
jgi:hypothetical protein